jgi:lipoate-protein ligase A
VVRRPTGGGVVFHDHDFTYSVVAPTGHWLIALDRMQSYHWVNRAVLAGLEACAVPGTLARHQNPVSVDRATMVCFQNPTRYDVMLQGRKVAGSAQRRTRDGILHQGSLHFGGPLPVPRPELGHRLRQGFRTVLNAELTVFAPAAATLELARELSLSRYGTLAWTRRR